MRFPDEVLMAYADGELQGELRAEVQQAVEVDPETARRVAEHAALRRSVEQTFVGVLNEPVPARLLTAAKRAAASASAGDVDRDPSKILYLRPKERARPSLRQWVALAASFLLGVGSWQLIYRSTGPVIVGGDGKLIATGALAQALSNQLVTEQTMRSSVQIGISFRSTTGNYCRTFQMPRYSSIGMACRTGRRWQVQVLGEDHNSSLNSAGYRQAASTVPAWLTQRVEDSIAGEPLDARAEASARAHGWH